MDSQQLQQQLVETAALLGKVQENNLKLRNCIARVMQMKNDGVVFIHQDDFREIVKVYSETQPVN